MGFGLPAAIGAQFGQPDKPVFCVSGDGSIQMCIQELMVATIYKLPIKICILNNQYLGMVRQWQELFWESKYSNVDLEASPDFLKLAEAYGAHGIRCSQPSGVRAALDEAMSITDRPTVLDFRIAKEENVLPDDQVRRHHPRHGRPAPARDGPPRQLHGRARPTWTRSESRPARDDEKTEREPVLCGAGASGLGNHMWRQGPFCQQSVFFLLYGGA